MSSTPPLPPMRDKEAVREMARLVYEDWQWHKLKGTPIAEDYEQSYLQLKAIYERMD